ncbi:ParA family protein [Candidatus Leptofilum sp.]|uniref:ParA family protein n=1 Tax=Candidatus Leptofilum sp. TaxID=3241576 RepID=UPI003B5957A5
MSQIFFGELRRLLSWFPIFMGLLSLITVFGISTIVIPSFLQTNDFAIEVVAGLIVAILSVPFVHLGKQIWNAWSNAKEINEDQRLIEEAFSSLPPNSLNEEPEIDVAADYWRKVKENAKITAIVSGKGGVGKSTIALGLLEYLSEKRDVLLVDFDLHNRGLTLQLQGILHDHDTTVMKELAQFKELKIEEKLSETSGSANELKLSDLSEGDFGKLRDQYCYNHRGGVRNLRPLQLSRFKNSTDEGDNNKFGPRTETCFFLPSRRENQMFLGSKESRMSESEIALFLKYLASFVYRHYGIREMIVDCHGALDLYMVGAILAADNIVITTLPELGVYQGTKELVDFSMKLHEALTPNDILVINQYRDFDKFTAERMKTLFEKQGENVIIIKHSEKLHRKLKRYNYPTISNEPLVYSKIKRIVDNIQRSSHSSGNKRTMDENNDSSVVNNHNT